MATTFGTQVRTVADIVQVLTKCSKADADSAELEICKRPSTLPILLTACGIGTASVGFGGRLIVAGMATSGGSVMPGVVIGGLGLVAAKRFCNAAINRSKAPLNQASSQLNQ